jgi:hypothetical protein
MTADPLPNGGVVHHLPLAAVRARKLSRRKGIDSGIFGNITWLHRVKQPETHNYIYCATVHLPHRTPVILMPDGSQIGLPV